MKHLLAKTYGWTVDYIDQLDMSTVLFLNQAARYEAELEEKETKKAKRSIPRGRR